jgi:hypothetical protein
MIEGEPPISPSVAREWALFHKRASEVDGVLVPDPKADHISLAGIAIASGDRIGYLSEAYAQVTDSRSPVSDYVLVMLADSITRFETPRIQSEE